MNNAPTAKQCPVPDIAFGVGLMRGIVAIAAGLMLIVYPDKSRVMLGNIMGIF